MISLHHSFVIDHIEDKKYQRVTATLLNSHRSDNVHEGQVPNLVAGTPGKPRNENATYWWGRICYGYLSGRPGNQTMAVFSRASLFVALLQLTLNKS